MQLSLQVHGNPSVAISQFLYLLGQRAMPTILFSDNKELITFGSNQFGQLGHGSAYNEAMPQKVEALTGGNISLVTCGDTFTVATTEGK